MSLNTAFLLMAQYNAQAVIPIELVQRDYFRHLTVEHLMRKVMAGDIMLPIVRIDGGKKAAKGVHLNDLAHYIDEQHRLALKEAAQLSS